MWVELWVRLKVVDLVAQTAWMTLTEKLDFADRIHGLLRYSFWGFTAEGNDESTALDEIDRVVRLDGAFTNQNKHQYRLMVVRGVSERGVPLDGLSGNDVRPSGDRAVRPSAPPPPELCRGDLQLEHDYAVANPRAGEEPAGLHVLDCLIRERDGERETGFTDRLNGRVRDLRVSNMKAGEVWRIIVTASGAEEALQSIERIAVTRSRREGLLLNPHYQTCELVSAFPLPAGAVRGSGG